MTRTADSVGTDDAVGREPQNHSPVDRQVGEPVAWRIRSRVNANGDWWNYSGIGEPTNFVAHENFDTAALIPASDLEQVTRERDEAVQLLGRIVETPHADYNAESEAAAIRAFLASLRSMEKTGGT